MRKSLILYSSRFSIHQSRSKNKVFFEFGVIFFPKRQRSLQIIIFEPFVIIHELNKISYSMIDSEIPQCASIMMGNRSSQWSDIMDISCIMHWKSCINLFVYDKNYFKILESLALQTFGDIFHILISPSWDDDAEFHSWNVFFGKQVSTCFYTTNNYIYPIFIPMHAMIKFLKTFLIFIVLYHILVTIICYGIFWWHYQETLSLVRDSIRIIFILAIITTHWKDTMWFIKIWKYPLITLSIVLIFSIGISKQIGKSQYDIWVGIKYGLRYIIIIITAARIGYSLAYTKSKEHFIKFLRRCLYMLVIIVIIWFLRQIAKLIMPEFFTKIGYGPLKDFIFGDRPPIYYLTGYKWTLRRQGIFSGPNNYGYFLTAFLPVIVIFFREKFDSIKALFSANKTTITHTMIIALRIAAIIMTLSRTAFIWGIVGLALANIQRIKKHKKVSRGILAFVILWLVGLSILKGQSTLDHIKAKFGSLQYVIQQPIGYGLGTSGPAIHHNGTILPENYYVQLMLDIGTIGFLLRTVLVIQITWLAKKIQKTIHIQDTISLLRQGLTIGRVALLIMGIFLHVFEDSMVNYLFFIIRGILTGYLSTSIKKT